MNLSEIFFSIQGEGKRSGCPSFFIRTNYCNLRCEFTGGNLCDTPYTSWNPADKDNLGEQSVSFIVKEYLKYKCKDIVITGGEPTMYTDELLDLCGSLKEANLEVFITIETNGTNFGEFINHVDLISISPKLKSSVPFNTEYEKIHQKNRINLVSFKKFQEAKDNDKIDIQWKFVFTEENDIEEIRDLQKEIGFKNSEVFLMPEGISREDLQKNRLKTVEACLKNNFNYTDRLHIMIWENKRGV